MWRGKIQSGVHTLWDEILTTNLKEEFNKFDIPVYFFTGIYDYTVSPVLSREFFHRIKAPVKALYSFDNSAHSPVFEEPEKFKSILRKEILKGEK